MYHNEVSDLCAGTIKQHPKKKRWKQKTKAVLPVFVQKFSLTINDMYEHIISLMVQDVRAISSLRHNNVDLSEDVIPSEMMKVCINTLTSQHLTPEQRALGYFT